MRLIDADALKELPFHRLTHTDWGETCVSFEEIDNAPTVEPIKQCKYCKHCGDEDWCSNCHSEYSLFEYYERPHGKWIYERPNGKTYSDFIYCSYCHKNGGFYKTNFCPNCGADMKGGAE